MPELAEVEYFRQRWDAGIGHKVLAIETHADTRIFREVASEELASALTGETLIGSEAQAKQMLFAFSGNHWLGLHLGMTGRLLCEAKSYEIGKWDHFVLRQDTQSLVFRDPRQFGLLKWHEGGDPPPWWAALPPPVLSGGFTLDLMEAFLKRRSKSPIKAVLLMQDRFPGIGNWMADEILWRAKIHPSTKSFQLDGPQRGALFEKLQEVARDALQAIAGVGEAAPPADLNVNIPQGWLFWHRWKDGGFCPIDGEALQRKAIGGRTGCWCPVCQPE
ncbi:MAG: DNA-formamidopyrimidine glycosylase family protein [Verrucomicrobiota bacterium]